ncbi:hypothetical protein GCM10010347_20890 [Streptomyces cirratus]|uniref:DUF7144 domain-containing protein n=1 Tax=Streptomyces cirratus TaxID=68187 RepID=A0ABQ3EXY2_9ACTN|nr:hypothetical protein [Streptomyces cirratus]GHB50994.1 hypothetical protein GCM10010347_20890 [Streptomyces cirratus]
MAQPSTPQSSARASRGGDPYSGRGAWAAGGTLFAGVLLLVYGVLGIIKGIAGIAKDDVYARLGHYVFKFNLTTWGWIHLILGIILVVVGAGLLKKVLWARVAGVVLAGLAIILDFMWLPYTPVWGIISIAIGVFVIWALCNTPDGPRSTAV